PLSERPRHGALDLCARRLDELAVADARGTHGLAGATVQALVHLLAEHRGIDSYPAFGDVANELDAASRRRGLAVQLAIGRAIGQAQAAVDASVDDRVAGHV